MRILMLGLKGSGKSSIVNRLKQGEIKDVEPTMGFNVTSVDFNNNRFTIWEVCGDGLTSGTWKQHTSNTQGIIFVLDSGNQELFEEANNQLQSILQDSQLAGIPLLVFGNKADSGGNLQEITEKLQLNSCQDREWFIQGSDAQTGLGVNVGFDWISKKILNKNTKNYSFEAEPKLVKNHQKYKPADSELQTKAQITYNNLMKDKKIILMNPVQQEQEYVRLEKERIKLENMHSQLINFKKNKKKMTPYQINPSPNPRIEVTLDFFLTDHNNNIAPEQSTVVCQTDQFHPPPKSPPYIPKKTGIDAATQVEDYELFNFDREVTPIVNVIVTKTLEQSMLEIEQEEEIQKMKIYKKQFYERRSQEKDKQQKTLEKEIERIKDKNKLLESYLERDDKKLQTLRRVQAYNIAGGYLQNLEVNCFEHLFRNGFYPNDLQINLKSTYIDWLVEETAKEIEKSQNLTSSVEGFFDQQCIPSIIEVKNPVMQMIEQKKIKKRQRRINDSNDKRIIRLFYNETKISPSQFAKDYARYVDGTLNDYKKAYLAKKAELQAKVDVSEMQDDDACKILSEEFPDTGPNYWSYSLQKFKRIGFTLAHNKYYQTMPKYHYLQLLCLALDKEGNIVQYADHKQEEEYQKEKMIRKQLKNQNQQQGQNNQKKRFIKYKKQIRDHLKKINDDELIMVDFERIPDDVSAIFFLLQIPNLANVAPLVSSTDHLLYSRFGIEDFNYNINIDVVNIQENFKLEELVRQPEGDQQNEEQCGYIIAYSIMRKPSYGWQLENIKVATKGIFKKDDNDFRNNLIKFWTECDGIVKDTKKQLDSISQGDVGESQVQDKSQLQQQHEANTAMRGSAVQSEQGSIAGQSSLFQKIYNTIEVKIETPYEQLIETFSKHIEQQDHDLTQICNNGYDFFVNGKPFVRSKQLKKIKGARQLEVRRKPDPIVIEAEPIVNNEENLAQGGEDEQNQGEELNQE